MQQLESHDNKDSHQQRRSAGQPLGGVGKLLLALAIIACFVLWAHFGSGVQVFRAHVSHTQGWDSFRASYGVDAFGADGYFTRAIQNGYNLFFHTHEHGERFTRKTVRDPVNSCSACHTAEDMAYAFVNSDRFEVKLGKRVSFEERVMRCYAGPMKGFVPTIYDPAVRDIRIFARAVAHHLQISEGAPRDGG